MSDSVWREGDRLVSHYYGPGVVAVVTDMDLIVARWDDGSGESYIRCGDPSITRGEPHPADTDDATHWPTAAEMCADLHDENGAQA